MSSSCLLFVDDRLMVDHFMMIKKMIKMDHLFGSFYDHQKWPRPIINQYTLNLAILGIAHHGFRDRAHTCVNMHQIETFPRARPAYQNIAHLFGVYRSTIDRPIFWIIMLSITLNHQPTHPSSHHQYIDIDSEPPSVHGHSEYSTNQLSHYH